MASIELLLPFYGDPGLMKQTVRSVLDQTDADWRLLVVDDGYPDDTVASWFLELGDERVTYKRNERNLGANGNYRRALSMATASHVVFLGADDLLLPSYVSRTKAVIADMGGDVAMYHPGAHVIDEGGLESYGLGDWVKSKLRPAATTPVTLSGERLATSLLRGNWTYFPSICWRRDAVLKTGFREGWHVVQDLAMLLDLIVAGHTLVLDPWVTFAYRRHTDSDSSVKAVNGERFAEEHAFFVRIESEMGEHGWETAARAARRHVTSRLNAASLLPTAVRNRDLRAAVQLVRHAVRRTR